MGAMGRTGTILYIAGQSLYTLLAGVVVQRAIAVVTHGADSPLAYILCRPAGALAVLAPIVIGLAIQVAGRRFWAWPWVYLLVFWQALPGLEMDFADQVYGHTTMIVWVLTIFIAESVGLAAGRFIHRWVAVGWFLVGGTWLFVSGSAHPQADALDRWLVRLMVTAGLLFHVHTGCQVARLLPAIGKQRRSRELARQAAVSDDTVPADLAAPDPGADAVNSSESTGD